MIDRTELVKALEDELWGMGGETDETCVAQAPRLADVVLALDKPDPRLRAVLLESLPADPRWAEWVDGVLERLR